MKETNRDEIYVKHSYVVLTGGLYNEKWNHCKKIKYLFIMPLYSQMQMLNNEKFH